LSARIIYLNRTDRIFVDIISAVVNRPDSKVYLLYAAVLKFDRKTKFQILSKLQVI
jgi:hypothetical protein